VKQDKNSNWSKIKRKENIIELAFGVVALIIILSALFFDFSTIQVGPYVKDFGTVSLTALQIQATLSAIPIALLALIGGFVSDEYHGVSITNYFLNIKPTVLKQKYIICGLLVIDAINLGCHLFKLYNVVISLAWITCLVIVFSAIEIYEILKGKRGICDEIDKYLDYILFSECIPINVKSNYLISFSEDWANKKLNSVEYEEYFEIYKKAINSLLRQNDIEGLNIISNVASNLVKKQSSESDKVYKYRAYKLFYETYQEVLRYIHNNENRHISSDFKLYEDCIDEVIDLLYEMPIDDLHARFSWIRTVDSILLVNIYCSNNKALTYPEAQEIKRIGWIVSEFGHALAKRKKNGEDLRPKRWKFDYFLFFCSRDVPEDMMNKYKNSYYGFLFLYYYSLLMYGLYDIAETVFQNNKHLLKDTSHELIMFKLQVFCYTYYIGHRETEVCVPKDEISAAKDILSKWREEDYFSTFIYGIAWDRVEKIESKLCTELIQNMDAYERLPLEGGSKTCIIQEVVEDFYVFVISMIIGITHSEEKVLDAFDDILVKEIFNKYFNADNLVINEKIKSIYEVFIPRDEQKRVLRLGMERLSEFILKRYKEIIMLEADNAYSNFDELSNSQQLVDNTRKIIDECVGNWFTKPDKEYTSIKKVLVKFTVPTRYIDVDTINQLKSNIQAGLLQVVSEDLFLSGRIDKYYRNENDEEYYQIIENVSCIIGPENAVSYYSYKELNKFDSFISEHNIIRIPMGYGNCGILLNCKQICADITDVVVSIYHVQRTDVNYEFNDETGMYKCPELTVAPVEFSESEFDEFLYKEKAKIVISMRINYHLPQEKLGYLVVNNKLL